MEPDGTPRAHERRCERRLNASEPARYMLVNHPERGWGPCRIADISRHGAGLVLFGPPWPRYRSEMRLLIELETGDDAAAQPRASLEAIVRNAGATRAGWLRVGVEFVTLSAEQRAIANEWADRLHASNA